MLSPEIPNPHDSFLRSGLTGAIHPELRSNLLTITGPNEVASGGPPCRINTYGTDLDGPLGFDRVITQVEGGTNQTGIPAGGTFQFYYEPVNEGADPADLTIPRRQTVFVDRNGKRLELLLQQPFPVDRGTGLEQRNIGTVEVAAEQRIRNN